MPWEGISFGCSDVHTSLPVSWLIAITFELRSPANSSPSPIPTPRLPLKGVSGLKVHSVVPVAGSSAVITPAVVTMNMRPSLTMGVASARSAVSAVHAPPSCVTLLVVRRLSVEYRVAAQSPPGAVHSLPAYAPSPADRIDATVSSTSTLTPASGARHPLLTMHAPPGRSRK